jgi:hypothetical protein
LTGKHAEEPTMPFADNTTSQLGVRMPHSSQHGNKETWQTPPSSTIEATLKGQHIPAVQQSTRSRIALHCTLDPFAKWSKA